MIDEIEDKENELECLKQLLSDANKQVSVYNPVKTD